MHINVIPLAGKGQRFIDGGYDLPKPLIDVNGEKMIFKAFNSLPKSDRNIFICKEEHIKKYSIDKLIIEKVYNSTVISDMNPEGQASSTYSIKNHVKKDDILCIGACDNSMVYDIDRYNKLLIDDDIDFIVWTFKNYHGINYNPNQYSYCRVDGNDNIMEVSLKQTISDNPIKDNCLVGAFTFKKANYLFDNYDELVKSDDKINGEFYLDSVINYCLNSGLKGKVFEIDKYIGFGTPNDLKTYEYWYDYFNING